MASKILSWEELQALASEGFPAAGAVGDTTGPANAHTDTRLFDAPPGTVPEVILYRDNHFWCSYCEKVQLFLEAKRIPYRMKFVSMYCYGQKEIWFKKIVPSGIVPAVVLEQSQPGRVFTESDDIITQLERIHGPLGYAISDRPTVSHRQRERKLFKAWCDWLCFPFSTHEEEQSARNAFVSLMDEFCENVAGPFILGEEFTIVDVVYIPYLERIFASVFYYKGYNLCAEHPKFGKWYGELQKLDCYRGIIADFHTHVHDLPPQMGGCYFSAGPDVERCLQLVDQGPYVDAMLGIQVDQTTYPEPANSCHEAAFRVIKHSPTLQKINPFGSAAVEFGLRATLTHMLLNSKETAKIEKKESAAAGKNGATGNGKNSSSTEAPPPPQHVDAALRHIKKRVCVPRDMPIWSAMRFRAALEEVASMYGTRQGKPIGVHDRYDQNPAPFYTAHHGRPVQPPQPQITPSMFEQMVRNMSS